MNLCIGTTAAAGNFGALARAGHTHLALSADDGPLAEACRRGDWRYLKEIRRMADGEGIDFSMAHAPYGESHDIALRDAGRRRRVADLMSKWIDGCGILGSPVLVIHAGGESGFECSREWEEIQDLNRDFFRRMAAKAEKAGIKIGVENLYDELLKKRGRKGGRFFGSLVDELLSLVACGKPCSMGICLDVGHANIQGLDLAVAVRETGAALCAVHLSDNRGGADDHLLPGRGSIDWNALIGALRTSGYDGALLLECHGHLARDRHRELYSLLIDVKCGFYARTVEKFCKKHDLNR
ncbi:MAG: sugar phosphate isomerase/epimerase [Verrucomicrobiae bacterium]|nr:sugar phosphate isomerase/epimerase [Verrucomicrobiae bacterium]